MTIDSLDDIKVPTRLGDFDNDVSNNSQKGGMILKDIFFCSASGKTPNEVILSPELKLPSIRGFKEGTANNA